MGTSGVFTPQVPNSDEVVLGEFKAYFNKGLPTETFIGATRGGCKIDVEKTIKDVKFDGSYGYQLDSSGNPLVRYEKLNARVTLEQLYLRYFVNTVLTGTWQSKNWTEGDSGVYAKEETIYLENRESYKMTGTNTNDGIHCVFAADEDLTEHSNGETVVNADDYIGFALYITTAGLAAMEDAKLELRLHTDAELTQTNYYKYEIEASDLTADIWNIFKVNLADFTQVASGSFATIKGASLIISSEATVTPTSFSVYFSSLNLIQGNTKSAIVPVNAGSFVQTKETTNYVFTPNLEVLEADYLNNLTIVTQKLDGNMVKIILENAYNDGAISAAMQEKDEVVNSTQFTAKYDKNIPTTVPVKFRFYK